MARKKKQETQVEDRFHKDKAEPSKKKQSETEPSAHMLEYLMLVFMAVFVFLIYSNNMTGPFVFDDEQNIRDNPHIRLKKLTFEGIRKAGFESHASYRPVANISFALNHYFHKYNLMGYHVVNILIHIATGILLFFFIKNTLKLNIEDCRFETADPEPAGSLQSPVFLVSFFTAFIWLVHPIQTQSVAYIVQRMNSMASMFYILSFLLYVKARTAQGKTGKTALTTGCILSGILALGSKQIAGTLPFFIFLYEWYFFQKLDMAWFKRRFLIFAGILVLFVVFAFIFIGANPLESILDTYKYRDFTIGQRLLTQFRVVIFYMSLLIFPYPSRLNLTHTFPLSFSIVDPVTTVFSIAIILGLIGLALYTAKKRPLISFCILWYFGNLAIESSVIALEIIFEHRNYLPSMLISLATVILIMKAANHSFIRQYAKTKQIGVGVMCILLAVLSAWTYQRNNVWSEDVSLWRDCVEKSPENVRPYNNLGIALSARKNYKEAKEIFSKALNIKPDYAYAHNNLGLILARMDRKEEAIPHYYEALRLKPDYLDAHYNIANEMADQEDYDKALHHFSMMLKINPLHENAHNSMGSVLARQDQNDKAIEHYYQALEINPDFAKAHNNLGLALAKKGRSEEAVSHYSEAIRINPEYAEAHYNIGLAFAEKGDYKGAVEQFEKAVRIKPKYMEAHNNLGNTLASQGKIKAATEHYSRAARIDPDFADAHYNLGVSSARLGKPDDAVAHYTETLRIDPEYSNAHYNLAVILQRRGKYSQAITHYSETLRIDPEDAEARRNLEKCKLINNRQ
ncbi:MAG: tetratricopeptide repeat protein [Desulfobacterales bacterium]|nr:tetratricopeptide repeat protein [Desulfobacterales bacterium]